MHKRPDPALHHDRTALNSVCTASRLGDWSAQGQEAVRPTINTSPRLRRSRAVSVASDTFGAMTAHPAEPVPDADPDEAAVAAAALREYREWVAKGRPGAVSHEEAMAELLGDPQ